MINKQEELGIRKLWLENNGLLDKVFQEMMRKYETLFEQKNNEWEHAKQSVEYLAKKQALIDLKSVLSKRYE